MKKRAEKDNGLLLRKFGCKNKVRIQMEVWEGYGIHYMLQCGTNCTIIGRKYKTDLSRSYIILTSRSCIISITRWEGRGTCVHSFFQVRIQRISLNILLKVTEFIREQESMALSYILSFFPPPYHNAEMRFWLMTRFWFCELFLVCFVSHF